MNVIGQFEDDRRDLRTSEQKHLDAQKLADAWTHTGTSPEVRLLSFDRWLRARLANRLDWTWAGAAKQKRIEQFRIPVEAMVLELWRRGWMLDGKALAGRIDAMLDAVATYQKRTEVRDLWFYFNAVAKRYVGQNSEEIQVEASRAGVHFGGALSALLRGAEAKADSMPELLARRAGEVSQAKTETMRAKVAKQRSADKAAKDQLGLF